MTTWLCSTQTGANTNGGTSISVRSTGTDGISNATSGLTLFSSIGATWGAGDVGHAIYASSGTITRLISAVQAQQTLAITTSSSSTTVTSSALFSASLVGCAISGPGISANTVVTVYTDSSHITISNAAGAGFGAGTGTFGAKLTTTGTTAFTAGTGQTWNVGGMKATINQCLVTASGVPNAIAAADSIYVGAGTYAETTAVAVSGTAGNAISLIGDVDGHYTGQPGQVTLSAYTSGNTSAPSGTALLALGSHTNLTFSFITFVGGASVGIVTNSAASAAANYTFSDCVFNAINIAGNANAVAFTSSTTGLALGVTIDRCAFFGDGLLAFTLTATTSGSGDYDALCVVRNSMFLGYSTASGVKVTGTSNTHLGGGVRLYGCTIFAGTAVTTTPASDLSTGTPREIHNCLVMGATGISAATSGQITGSYNVIYAATPESNYTYGTGDVSNSAGTGTYKAPLLELGQSLKWAGILRQFLAPDGLASPLTGVGSSTFTGNYPTVDWANRARPSGGKSASASVGYSEFHDFAAQNTTTYPTGYTSSGELIGPGDQDIWIPVDAVATVLTIQMYQGAGYTGTTYANAVIQTNNEIGVATATQTCSSTTGSWQTLTFGSFTPTAKGWIKLRVSSFDTSGAGTLFFGALT